MKDDMEDLINSVAFDPTPNVTAPPAAVTCPPELALVLATPPERRLALMVEFLATKDRRRKELAVRVLVGMGADALPFLVREAVCPGKLPDHRIRLLDIVLAIGGRVGVEEWFSLLTASAAYRGRVREKIDEVLLKLGHAGPWRTSVAASRGPMPCNAR